MTYNSSRDSTLLMIQWVIWKHLAPILIMDGEKFQRMAEDLAQHFYDEGVRMPLDDDVNTTPLELQSELLRITDEIGPPLLPQSVVRERVLKIADRRYNGGWRKFSDVAA